MDRKNLIRLAAIASFCVAAAPRVHAQIPTISPQPASLTFDLRSGIPQSQNVYLALTNTTAPSATVRVAASNGLRVNNFTTVQVVVPATIFVSVDPAITPGISGTIEISGLGIQGAVIPVCFIRSTGGTQCPGTGTGTGNFQASTSSLTFTQTGTSPPTAQQFTVSGTGGFVPTYTTSILYTSGGATNWLQVIPAPGFASQSSIVTVSPATSGLGTGTYTATLSLQPTLGGYNSISIPITLNINTGSGTGNFYSSPSVVTFNYGVGTTAPITQQVTIYGAASTGFTIIPSTNLSGVVSVSPAIGTTPATVNVTLLFPGSTPANSTGFLTVTPTFGSVYQQFTIPVQINPSGTGSGSLVVNPTSLTFSTTPGSTAPQSQLINVTSSDFTQQAFSVATSSTGGFLTAFASGTVTPATVTVGINPSAISQVGTYNGFVTITPATGIGAGIPVTVPVTVNVGTGSIIQPSVTSVTLESRAGSTTPVTSDLRLDVPGTIRAVDFTTTVKTASGGEWLSVQPASGTAPSPLRIVASAASLAPGNYAGTVTVNPTAGAAFDIRVIFNVTASGELRVSTSTLAFTHQTTSTASPAAQTVTISSTGTPLNWTATPTSTGNWLQVSPTSGVTGTNNLSVSVNPTGLAAGSYTGSISVSSANATNPAQTISVTLTVTTPVVPQVGAFVNAASFGPSVASPGLIATITGTNLGPSTAMSATPGPSGYPTVLGETQVLFDGRPAPLIYVSATQVSTVVPFELAGRVTTRMQVDYRGQRSSELELRVTETAPGVFTLNQSGTGQGAVLNQNSSVNGPSNPERRGNVVVIYATGLGVVFPAVATGTVVPGASQTTVPARVRIGGVEARVLYSGAAPGLIAGAYQINAVIPESVTPGSAVTVSVEAGLTGLSQPGVTIAVQ